MTIRAEVKGHFVSGVSDEGFGITLIQGLFENIHAAVAIGGKQNLLAIDGPIRRKIISVIESEAARVDELTVSHNISDIYVSLRKPPQRQQALPVARHTQGRYRGTSPARDLTGLS